MCRTCVYRVWLVDDCDIDCDVGFVLGGLLENLECVVEGHSEVELRGVATSSTM